MVTRSIRDHAPAVRTKKSPDVAGLSIAGGALRRGACRNDDPPRRHRAGAGIAQMNRRANYSAATGILPILACHSFGPVWCTDTPVESTATVTGMSLTSNS
ncbi:hypothetical protein PNO31109_03902 [Pandoraea nosoerga]|uniref:Uncharacterized protein n=1 Tax=Pandoraea nosoerga TaxID=2508296 RepID=A0A5E4XID4_9BURK|nr:hypothetical protein PNO31109_03902 [Pandoraea nosoerga]